MIACNLRLKQVGDQRFIWDLVRKRWLTWTPEEQVRQCTLIWLVNKKGFDLNLIQVELQFELGSKSFRADIVCFSVDLQRLMLVECKATEVKIDQTTLEQAVKYNSVIAARFVMLTNGSSSYFFERDTSGKHSQIDETKVCFS